jgi:hypothetical protein
VASFYAICKRKEIMKMAEETKKEEQGTVKKSNKKIILGIVGLIALVAVFIAAYVIFRPKASAGDKDITIEVINSAKESTVYELSTDAEYLQQAMDEAEGLEYSGDEGEYGLMITTVNGERAVFDENQAYWSFYLNGEYCNYGIAEQVVTDGDLFQIIYTESE